jgi:tetratricopeptide (TPR) repeat protein
MAAELAPETVGDVKGNLGRALLLVGQTDEAALMIGQASAVMRLEGRRLGDGLWTGRLGEVLLRLGKVEQALKCQEFALSTSQAADDRRWQVTHLSNLGETYRVRGDHAAATRFLQQGLIQARSTNNRHGEAYCSMRLARVCHETGALGQAREYYAQAIEAGFPPCNFQSAVQLGILLLEISKPQEAREYLSTGAALCRGLLDRTPRLCDAIYSLALALVADGRHEEGLATYHRALEVCSALGVVQVALQDLRQLQRVRPPREGLAAAMRLLEKNVPKASD